MFRDKQPGSSDDETGSEPSPENEDTADVGLDKDFVDLTPEDQAQEIAAVYQQIAELVTGGAKEQLLTQCPASADRWVDAGRVAPRARARR